MTLNELKPNSGSRTKRRRICRGGKLGKTGGRGMNGQSSRSGGTKYPGFEGGQSPWYRRLPKYRGFKNLFRTEYQEVSLSDLEAFENKATVNPESLLEKGIIKNVRSPIKVLGNGELKKSLTVNLHAFTNSAKEAIEGAGGTAEVI
ncbi:MAG: 50S ribosomal protein L15 [Vulcanimicrobiota bacterium]